ncbi:hypothetical protein A0J61_11765 [Choanephora cucurbitarum]|uniref:ISXO2-like transposase domain-containing protein n=1 Tax=Choanephora cucurbitarum TaxID=101091 RepID=A0A1C7MUT3_9FUNG|nr:hypothetical protein A0J61_11765 [Choanephora cucurbitarum]
MTDCHIGGYDKNGSSIIVEIDELKFGKRKRFRGHHVEGVWVVGGVERTPHRHCFMVVVPDRSARTLLSMIEEFVLPATTVHTDCWAGYNLIESMGRELAH